MKRSDVKAVVKKKTSSFKIIAGRLRKGVIKRSRRPTTLRRFNRRINALFMICRIESVSDVCRSTECRSSCDSLNNRLHFEIKLNYIYFKLSKNEIF